MPYELPPLPYDYDDLEPTIDGQTMRIHHGKHHQAYVDNLNKAVEGTELDGLPVEELVAQLDKLPEDRRTAARNNGGGHANHSLFWTIMTPGGGGEPAGALADAIGQAFGDPDQLKAQVNDAGVKRFGSGWTWVIADGERELDLEHPQLGVHLVRGGEIDVGELAEDLVALGDVALVELVVGGDRVARDAVELV